MSEATAIKEHPILFSGEMVRAILAGRKTVTRRVVKPQPPDGWSPVVEHYCPVEISADGEEAPGPLCFGASDEEFGVRCPYGEPGDRLWVREAWRRTCDTDALGCVQYKADGAALHYLCDNGGEGDPTELAGPAGKLWDEDAAKWRPSIHMPRWVSRILLEVKSVQVERLQEITEADAEAEGFERREHFIRLWDQLNASRGCSWESNPWVWRVEFKRVEGNK